MFDIDLPLLQLQIFRYRLVSRGRRNPDHRLFGVEEQVFVRCPHIPAVHAVFRLPLKPRWLRLYCDYAQRSGNEDEEERREPVGEG